MSLNATAGTDSNLWAIVLAGGEGTRLRPFIEDWLGEPRPKQFCPLLGTRSMLAETVERATGLVPPDRVLVVIGPGQRRWLDELPDGIRVLEQPDDRGTGAATFLGLAHVLAADRDGLALLLPADQFVFPTERFTGAVRAAVDLAADHDDIVHIGVEATSAESDYGWLRPGRRIAELSSSTDVRRVLELIDKPDPDAARHFLKAGYLWASMVIACRAGTLWRLGVGEVPELYRFGAIRNVLHSLHADRVPERQADRAMEHVYEYLEPVDLSRDLLRPLAQRSVTVPLSRTLWSDFGRPERIARTAAWLGKWPELVSRLPAEVVQEHLGTDHAGFGSPFAARSGNAGAGLEASRDERPAIR